MTVNIPEGIARVIGTCNLFTSSTSRHRTSQSRHCHPVILSRLKSLVPVFLLGLVRRSWLVWVVNHFCKFFLKISMKKCLNFFKWWGQKVSKRLHVNQGLLAIITCKFYLFWIQILLARFACNYYLLLANFSYEFYLQIYTSKFYL